MTRDPLMTPEDRAATVRWFIFIAGVVLFMAALGLSAKAEMATIRSKSGAKAYVASSSQAKFQALINWLDQRDYPIKFMGGWRRGKCWTGGMHPCGKAIDINQVSRGRVVARLPAGVDAFARSIGLVPGSGWCNQDQGHFQVGGHDGCFRAGKNNLFRRYAEAKGVRP
jgi:hypothetical protein